MNPDVRLTKKISAICVCVTWCMAIACNIYFGLLLSQNQWGGTLLNLSLCTVAGHNVYLGIFYILVFLCTIPLYIHMYIVDIMQIKHSNGRQTRGSSCKEAGSPCNHEPPVQYHSSLIRVLLWQFFYEFVFL